MYDGKTKDGTKEKLLDSAKGTALFWLQVRQWQPTIHEALSSSFPSPPFLACQDSVVR